MGKIKTIELTAAQRAALEKGYREGQPHSFRVRCQIILLKTEHRTAAEIADLLGTCLISVYQWINRYQAEGIEGLRTKPGRGRKPIFNTKADLPAVRRAVQRNRKRISLAKAELEEALGKSFSQKTLVRFLKNTIVAINESENVRAKSPTRKFTG